MTVTIEDAKQLQYRNVVHISDNAGQCTRFYVNGKVRTWKRNPNRIRIPLKFGMYSFGLGYAITEDNVSNYHREGDCNGRGE